VRAPGWWSDRWTCTLHGEIAPLQASLPPTAEALQFVAARSSVPVWVPWPLPVGWLLSGIRFAGDDHTGPVATVVAASGPNPLPDGPDEPRAADLLLVAEQPGVGLGARLAGQGALDPGVAVMDLAAHERAHLKLAAAGHDVPLWSVTVAGGAGYAGEAAGVWLWALAWPEHAAAVMLEPFDLVDVRDPGHLLDLPFGAPSPRLG
jgi:hypothetical protein